MSELEITKAPFDEQAVNYDNRAGLSEDLCIAVAKAVADITAIADEHTILELGCGTGQIGSQLDKLPGQYSGFDLSNGMLAQFLKNHPDLNGSIFQADGRSAWPFENNCTNIIFSSRAIHWIDVPHIVSEAYRVSTDNKAYLLIGRIESPQNCWSKRLRRQMHLLLRDNELTPRDGQKHLKRLRQAIAEKDGQEIEPVIVDSWRENRSLKSVIENWRGKEGLAGTQPSAELKNALLVQLQQWGEQNLGGSSLTEVQRNYVIYGFKLS